MIPDGGNGICCALGDTAWTDLFSNQTQLSGFDPKQDLIPLLTRHDLPDRCVLPFLHESLHSLCFQSPVGYSAAYLHFRTLLDLVGYREPKERVRANLLKTTALHLILRPLSEGIAMFCELDVFPRASEDVWSEPFWWLYFFTKPNRPQELTSPSSFGDSMYLRLMRLRSSPEFIRHRQSLLLHPIDTSRGGYLSGYMTVKRLWYWAASRCPKFTGPDFFLRYLILYFYSDLALVWALHSSATSVSAVVDPILATVQLRLSEFYSLDFEKEAEKLDTQDRKKAADPLYFYELGETNDDWPLARQALDRMLASVAIPHPNSDAEHMLRLTGLYLAQRELLCIAKVPIEVRRIDGNSFETIFDDLHLPRCQYVPGTSACEGEAVLAYYVSLYNKRIVQCITQGMNLVSLTIQELQPGYTPKEQISSYILDFAELRSLTDGLSVIYQSYVNQNSPEGAVTKLSNYIQEIASQVYARHALQSAGEDAFPALYLDLQKSGLNGILGGLDALKALATVSTGATLGMDLPEILQQFRSLQPEIEEEIKKVSASAEARGLQIYEEQPARIVSFV
jgi:hypothetical protein